MQGKQTNVVSTNKKMKINSGEKYGFGKMKVVGGQLNTDSEKNITIPPEKSLQYEMGEELEYIIKISPELQRHLQAKQAKIDNNQTNDAKEQDEGRE